MSDIWQKNIRTYRTIIQQNLGPKVVNVVSGSPADQAYWQERLEKTRQDVFRADGETMILSSLEKTRKGNFLGSVNAWHGYSESTERSNIAAGDIDEHGIWFRQAAQPIHPSSDQPQTRLPNPHVHLHRETLSEHCRCSFHVSNLVAASPGNQWF